MIFAIQQNIISQEPLQETTKKNKKEFIADPQRATMLAVTLPGMGQIYNRKYWKVPVIYAGFGVMTYFIYTNTDEYLNFKCAYIESSYGNMNGNYSYLVQRYSKEELLSLIHI